VLDLEAMYVDQAPQYLGYSSAAYTPYGIHVLDDRFCNAIRAASTLGECRYIHGRLLNTPNLHPVVKENLVLNLVNCMVAITSGRVPDHHECSDACYVDRCNPLLGTWRVKTCSRRHIEEL
jgi:hypothetical protein